MTGHDISAKIYNTLVGEAFAKGMITIVQQDYIDNYFISTVRLREDMIEGIGYSYETMIKLDDGWTDYQVRCNTIEEARIQHNAARQWVIYRTWMDDKS